jgi:hypothetical protein
MAGSQVVFPYFFELRFLLTAKVFSIEAASVKTASWGRIDGTGDVSLEYYPVPSKSWIGNRGC